MYLTLRSLEVSPYRNLSLKVEVFFSEISHGLDWRTVQCALIDLYIGPIKMPRKILTNIELTPFLGNKIESL